MRSRVDFAHGEELDKFIEGKAALPPKLHELRDEDVGHAVALDDAAHGPPKQDAVHVEGEFGAEGGDADHAANAGQSETVDRLADNLRQTGRLERVLDSLAAR